MVMITIGRVAKQAAVGVGVETIGSYEWEGLIEEPPRWVRRAKELGFAPKVFKELMSLQDGGGRRGDEVRAIAEANMRDADQKLAWLQAMRSALYGLV